LDFEELAVWSWFQIFIIKTLPLMGSLLLTAKILWLLVRKQRFFRGSMLGEGDYGLWSLWDLLEEIF
jgi:hypothetical protein